MSKNNLEIITLNKPGIVDFAKERNILLNKAKSEWVLFIDTDETLTKELKKEIEEKTQNESWYNGFYIKRKIYFCGQLVGEDRVLRLARKNSGRWIRAVHEIWEVEGKAGVLNNYIIHNTANNLYEYIAKLNKYSTVHAAENLKEGKRSNLIKIIIYPKLKFVQNILLGRSFVFSLMQALHSFLSWVKLWELQNV